MITKDDLEQAIAECQGERDPNAHTCMKLAAFYTIYNQMYGNSEQLRNDHTVPMYSTAPAPPEPAITYNSGSAFSDAVHGKDINYVISVVDEMMSALWCVNPRLYNDVMRTLTE